MFRPEDAFDQVEGRWDRLGCGLDRGRQCARLSRPPAGGASPRRSAARDGGRREAVRKSPREHPRAASREPRAGRELLGELRARERAGVLLLRRRHPRPHPPLPAHLRRGPLPSDPLDLSAGAQPRLRRIRRARPHRGARHPLPSPRLAGHR